METVSLKEEISTSLTQLREASRKLIQVSDQTISSVLNDLASLSVAEASYILSENQKDLDRMDKNDPKYDRLLLNKARIEGIAGDLRKVASLPSPLHELLEERTLPNGLAISRVSVPLGIIGIVFESRPNVTFDVFALCLKAGNAAVLKGSRDAHFSNIAIVKLINQVLVQHNLEGVLYLAPSEREALAHILNADDFIDTIIPRGGRGLIDYVRANSRVPVIETGAGIVHTYFDKAGDLDKGKNIVTNAKSRRVSVCNALDTLLIHQDRLPDLPLIMEDLDKQHHCKVFADQQAFKVLNGKYNPELLSPASEADFGTEFLSMQMSVKTVNSIEEAIDHVAKYSSKHSEAIISEDLGATEQYLKSVDAAVVFANTSTAFTDGAQFGLGAEIGISTQKLHARGPMALKELTSYKWIVRGSGQIRD